MLEIFHVVAKSSWKLAWTSTHHWCDSVMHITVWDKLRMYKSFLKSCWIKNGIAEGGIVRSFTNTLLGPFCLW